MSPLASPGLDPLEDYRGSVDRSGRKLTGTIIAVADQFAAAAGILMRKSAGCPVVLLRGFDWKASRRLGTLACSATVNRICSDEFAPDECVSYQVRSHFRA